MTRLSTSQTYDATIDRLVRRQADLSDAQERMSSGKRVTRASDDPSNAARAERALSSLQRVDAGKRTLETSKTMMTQAESALGDANELLQQARELMVASGNPAYTDSERQAIATQLAGIRSQLLGIANRSDGANGFLFSGQGSQQPPFVDGPGGVTYSGDAGQNMVGRENAMPLTFDGRATWLTAPTGNGVFATSVVASTGTAVIDGGSISNATAYYAQPPSTYDITFNTAVTPNTYTVVRTPLPPAAAVPVTSVNAAAFTPGQAIQVDGMTFTITGNPASGDQFRIRPSTETLSVFDSLDKAVSDLSASGRTSTQITQANAQNLNNMDAVMQRLQLKRSDAGNTLTMIDNATDRLASQKLQSETERSNAEDLDMVQAISEFQTKQTGYDAALRSYSMVQKLSLFQYLNG